MNPNETPPAGDNNENSENSRPETPTTLQGYLEEFLEHYFKYFAQLVEEILSNEDDANDCQLLENGDCQPSCSYSPRDNTVSQKTGTETISTETKGKTKMKISKRVRLLNQAKCEPKRKRMKRPPYFDVYEFTDEEYSSTSSEE